MLTLPWLGSASTALVTLSASPSTSLSLPSTSMLGSATLIGVSAWSALATGASLVPVMVRVRVLLPVAPCSSVTVKPICSTFTWFAARLS